MTEFKSTAVSTVLGGMFIPAHDETFDLAEEIGGKLDEFHEYVAGARSEEQADNAVTELLEALAPAPKQDHSFRVVHEWGGRVAYEGASYIEAATEQTNRNVLEQSEGRPPKWRLWLIDPDGIGVIVKTQVE